MLQVFKEFITKATEALRGPTPSATLVAPKGGNPGVANNSDTDQWLEETNALKTEKVSSYLTFLKKT